MKTKLSTIRLQLKGLTPRLFVRLTALISVHPAPDNLGHSLCPQFAPVQICVHPCLSAVEFVLRLTEKSPQKTPSSPPRNVDPPSRYKPCLFLDRRQLPSA